MVPLDDYLQEEAELCVSMQNKIALKQSSLWSCGNSNTFPLSLFR